MIEYLIAGRSILSYAIQMLTPDRMNISIGIQMTKNINIHERLMSMMRVFSHRPRMSRMIRLSSLMENDLNSQA